MIVYDSDLNTLRMNAEAYAAIADKTGFGEPLEVKTKSLGTLITYQFQFKSTALQSAKSQKSRPKAAE